MSHLLAGQLLGKKYGKLASQGAAYQNQIIATAPITYWPLNELSGTAAVNYGTLGTAANGTYDGVTLAQTPAPGGGLAPSWDGTNDFLNVYSAALAGGFNGALGSAQIWWKVSGAGVWADTTVRAPFAYYADDNNRVVVIKTATNDELQSAYVAAGTAEVWTSAAFANTAWNLFMISWSKAAEEVKYYMNGALLETDINLGIWAGALAATLTTIGAYNTAAPTFVWSGYLAQAAIWDKVITLPEHISLYNSGL